MPNDATVTSLDARQIEQAGSLLGRAFADDPLMSFWVPNPSQRRQHLPALMRVAVRYTA